MRDILLLGVVLTLTAIALRRPAIGMLAFVGLGLLNPHSMAWSVARTFPMAQVTALGTLVGLAFSGGRYRMPLRRETVLLAVLWAVFVISSVFADFPDTALEHLLDKSKILLMIFASMMLITTREHFHWLLRIIALSIGFHAARGGMFFLLTGGQYRVWGPEESFLYANNSIGLAMAMNAPLLYFLSGLERRVWLRWLMRAMLALTFPAVIGTYSRGAWLGVGAATVLVILKSRHTILLLIAALILVSVAMPLMPDRAVQRYDDLRNYKEESSAQSRFWNWTLAWQVALANPFFGAGFDYYSLEAYIKYFPEFLDEWPGKVWSCHSVWFTVLSEHGFVGFFLWTGVLISALFSLRGLRKRYRREPGYETFVVYCDMLFIAIVTYTVPGSFLDAAYFDLYFQLVAAVVMLKQLAPRWAAEGAELDQQAIAGTEPPIVGSPAFPAGAVQG